MTLQKEQLYERLLAINLALTEADRASTTALAREEERDFVCLANPHHPLVRSSLRSLLVRSPEASSPFCAECRKEFRIARVNRQMEEQEIPLHLQSYDTDVSSVGVFTCDLNSSHRPFTTSIPYALRGVKRCLDCVREERLIKLSERISDRNATVAPKWRVTVLDSKSGTEATFRCAAGHVFTSPPNTVLSSNHNGCRKCYCHDAKLVNALLRKQGNPIELTGEYFNANTKTEFKCLADPSHPSFLARPTDKVWKKTRCKQCAREQRHAAALQRRAANHAQQNAVRLQRRAEKQLRVRAV